MRFVVTGGTGFVGSHLVPRLARLGPVTALQRPDGPHPLPSGCASLAGDITEPRDLERLPAADVVVHLAGEASPQRAQADPDAARRANVDGTRHVAEAALARGARLVFLSTGQVYGRSRGRPFREDDPLDPSGPYATSKAEAEREVAALAREGLSAVTLRCFNMYGPGQTGPYVVPDLMQAVAAGRTPTLRDLAPARDFLFIGDAAAAMELAATAEAVPPVLNVASGAAVTIGELAATACRLAGVPPQEGPSVSADRLEADVSRLRELGWAPRVPLEEGLRRTLDWWRQRG